MEPAIFSKEFKIILSLFWDSIYVNLQRYATCIMELHACLHLGYFCMQTRWNQENAVADSQKGYALML